MNEADEKDINNETFSNYFKYQNPSILAKDLIRAKQSKNEQLVHTQPPNIGPQDVPRTSPSNVPRTSPKDLI